MASKGFPSSSGLELTGDYRRTMEIISAQLMESLPEGDALWTILIQAEALLLEAQQRGMPIAEIFPQGGIAGFCQSIVDEQLGKQKSKIETTSPRKQRKRRSQETTNTLIKRKKNTVTILVLLLWVLIVAFLVAHYTGFLPYLIDPHNAYLEELHNFDSSSTVLTDTERTISLRLSDRAIPPQIIYQSEEYQVTLTAMGSTTGDYIENESLRRFWIELCYTQTVSFSKVSYVSPAETGTARITFSDGRTSTHTLHWQDNGRYEDGTAYVRLCFLELPASTVIDDATVEFSLDPMIMVTWYRTGVGVKAK